MEHEWIVFGKEKKSKKKMRNGKEDWNGKKESNMRVIEEIVIVTNYKMLIYRSMEICNLGKGRRWCFILTYLWHMI